MRYSHNRIIGRRGGEYPNGRNSGVKLGKVSDTSDKRPRSDGQPLARSRLINTDPAGDPGFGLPKAYPATCLTLCNRRQESDSDI